MSKRLYNDITVGETFTTGEMTLTKADIISFAEQWDPQPMHTDENTATHSLFGTLVASGWHTFCATMRLVVASKPLGDTPLVGRYVKEAHMFMPVTPGTTLYAAGEVLNKRLSRKTPEKHGYATLRIRTYTTDDQLVAEQIWTTVVPVT